MRPHQLHLATLVIAALALTFWHAAAADEDADGDSGASPTGASTPENTVREYFAARSTLNERVLEDERESTKRRVALLEREQRIVADDAPNRAQLKSLRAQLTMTQTHADRLATYDVRILGVRALDDDHVIVDFRLTVWQPPAGEPMHAAIAAGRELEPVRRELESELRVVRDGGSWRVEGSQD